MARLRHGLIWQCLEGVEPGASMLEVGCGLGAMGARLAQRFDYLGVETDEASARVARERLAAAPGGRVLHASFDAIEGRFDVVCAFEVLEHLEDDVAALRGWRALLRPGGRLVISVPAYQCRFGPGDEMVGHYRRYDPDALTRLLERVGFDHVTLHLYGFPLGQLSHTLRDLLARRRGVSGSRAERTAGSGRLLQPESRWQGAATSAIAAPFGLLQRLAPARRRGIGIVASARAGG
jgi:SAM-dependent methyltransferase